MKKCYKPIPVSHRLFVSRKLKLGKLMTLAVRYIARLHRCQRYILLYCRTEILFTKRPKNVWQQLDIVSPSLLNTLRL